MRRGVRYALTLLLSVAGTALAQPPGEDVVDLRPTGKDGRFDPEQPALRGVAAADVKLPRPRKMPARRFEEIAKAARRDGVVGLECRIQTNGRTSDCRVVQSVAKLVDEAALDAVREWQFTPLTVRGVPHAALMPIRLGSTFHGPTGRTADPTNEQDRMDELRYKGNEFKP